MQSNYNIIVQYKNLAVQNFGDFIWSTNLADNMLTIACAILQTFCIFC